MTTRILPPEEWHRLTGTEVESIVPGLDPAQTAVLVVEDGAAIIGTWVLLRMVHVECFWIAPAHRGKAGVAARLLRTMRGLLPAWGSTCPITGSVTPEMTSMIERLGGIKLPGDQFALPMGGV
jgi:alkylation response protein AidB-like acyl-CoA dehydrogenase